MAAEFEGTERFCQLFFRVQPELLYLNYNNNNNQNIC